MDTIIGFIEFMFGLVVFLIIALVVLLIVISKFPESNPLRQILVAVSKRVGLMVGLGVVALPLEIAPPIEALYDLVSFGGIVYYWFTLARDIRNMGSRSSVTSTAPRRADPPPQPRPAPRWPAKGQPDGGAPGRVATQRPAPGGTSTKPDDDIADLYGDE
jgi:hypothetical protein